MPTRRSADSSKFSQSRFSSSSEFQGPLLGNLVSRRASVLSEPADRDLIYWLQGKSIEPGGLRRFAEALSDRLQFSADSFKVADFAGYLAELCLNPEIRFSTEKEIADLLQGSNLNPHLSGLYQQRLALSGWLPGFGNVISPLREMMEEERKSAFQGLAQTSISSQIFEDLEYCRFSRKLVIIEGRERIGKSVTAQAFSRANPGRCAFVRLEPGDDDNSFFRSIAGALGTTRTAQRKANEVRARIEDTLQQGHLMLIIDEAHFLWPQRQRVRSAPKKIDWLRTALIDNGVPVALVSTPQFLQQCERCDSVSGWNSGQIKGRVGLHRRLDQSLSRNDILAIVELHLPGLPKTVSDKIVAFSLRSESYVACIEMILSRAQFFARRRGDAAARPQDVISALAEMQPDAIAPRVDLSSPSPIQRSEAISLGDSRFKACPVELKI